jgi:hypothetical protein
VNSTVDTATKTKRNRRTMAAVIGAGAAVVIGGTAWAAVALFGFGTANVAATTTTDLTVEQVSVTSPLLPGAIVGAKGLVKNPNAYPVKVVTVYIREAGASGVPAAACNVPGVLIPQGAYANHGTNIGNGWKTELTGTAVVEIPANNERWVEIPQAVKQISGSETMCGFTANIAVKALAGN